MSSRVAIGVVIGLGLVACTRGNPAFGDTDADSATSAESTSVGETSGASGSQSASGQTSVDSGATEGESGGGGGICGDNVVDSGEECDKGRENSNVGGCKVDCTWNVCGDGYVGPEEACDQPADVDEQYCTHDCKIPTCGNGVVDRMEACDPTANPATGECTPICTINACGDAFVRGGEACDEGAQNSNTGACKLDCTDAACGDGYVHAGVEDCDGEVPPGVSCMDLGFFAGTPACDPVTCMLVAENCNNCGNGATDEDEQCDPSDPNGLGQVATPCANTAGWMGMGQVWCDEACLIGVEGGCCHIDGQPCDPDIGTNVFCCSQFCDDVTGQCGG